MTAIPISDGLTRFAVQTPDGEKEIALDLVEATQQYNSISKTCRENQLDNFEYLDQFGAWLQQATGTRFVKGQVLELVKEMDRQFQGKADRPAGEPGPS